MDHYKKELMTWASNFDAMTNAQGEVAALARAIVNQQDNTAAVAILKRISSVLDSKTCTDQMRQVSRALKGALTKYYGYLRLSEICSRDDPVEDTRTLSQLLEELDGLVYRKPAMRAGLAYG